MKVFRFEAWHAECIDLQPHQQNGVGFYTPKELAAAGDAITVVHDGTILFCGGRQFNVARDHWTLWALVAKQAAPFMLPLTRIIRRTLDSFGGTKIAYIHRDFVNGARWAHLVGMRFEATGDFPMPDGSLPLVYRADSERPLTAANGLIVKAAVEHGQVDCPVQHHFSEGMYARKVSIPKGTLVVGKVHKRQTLNICAAGAIAIMTSKGPARFKAGDVVVTEPGIQKIGYALEDTVWINIHPTDETDLELIEARFVEDPKVPHDAVALLKALEAA